MTWFIAVLGALIAVMGLIGVVQPDRVREMVDVMGSQKRFVFGVVVRLVMGAVLWWVADELRHPQIIRVLAVIAVVAAVIILIAGRVRLDRMVEWWLRRSDGVLRLSMVFATVFGVWLAWEAV